MLSSPRTRGPRFPRAIRSRAFFLTFASILTSGPALLATTPPASAETLQQAEQRMSLIEAITPPREESPADGLGESLARLQRLENEAITVTAPLVNSDGTPVTRKPGTAEPTRCTISIDASQSVARFNHWEKGYAPLALDVPLPETALTTAKASTEREKRVVTIDPIALNRGKPATLQLRSPDGHPLAGALTTVRARPREGKDSDLPWDQALWLPGLIEANAQGVITIENLSGEFSVLIRVFVPGFHPAVRVFENLSDGQPITWTLEPATPVQGRVVDAHTGEPLADTLVEFSRLSPKSGEAMFGWDELANAHPARTDADGRFVLKSIHPEWRGAAILKRHGYADFPLGDFSKLTEPNSAQPPQPAEAYAMRRGHRLAGHLRVPAGFLRDLKLFVIEAEYVETGPAQPGHRQRAGSLQFWKKSGRTYPVAFIDRLEFDPEATDIPFVFPNLGEGRLRLKVFFSTHRLFAETQIDLTADRNDAELTVPAMGYVEVSLVSPTGEVLPVRGQLGYYRTDGRARGPFAFGLSSGDHTAPVISGRTTVALFGEENKRKIIFVDQQLTGYRFVREARHGGPLSSKTFDLPTDGAPLRVAIPVEPAGAFRVRILEDNGQPAPEGEGEVNYHFLGPDFSQSGSARSPYSRLLFSPVALDAEYELVVSRGHRITTTSKVTLTSDNPAVESSLRFASGVRVSGQVLDATGKSVAGAKIRLGYQYIKPQPTMLIPAGEQITGPNGEFVFEGVNLDMPNPWWLETVPEKNGPPELPRHLVSIDAPSITLQLPAVHATRGQLLDHETGSPVSGIEVAVWLRPRISSEGRPAGWTQLRQGAVEKTNTEGVFHFKNLTAGVYEFRIDSGEIVTSREQVKAPHTPNDTRKWPDLLQVPETKETPNVFWYRSTEKR